jgi:hypothetical protein
LRSPDYTMASICELVFFHYSLPWTADPTVRTCISQIPRNQHNTIVVCPRSLLASLRLTVSLDASEDHCPSTFSYVGAVDGWLLALRFAFTSGCRLTLPLDSRSGFEVVDESSRSRHWRGEYKIHTPRQWLRDDVNTKVLLQSSDASRPLRCQKLTICFLGTSNILDFERSLSSTDPMRVALAVSAIVLISPFTSGFAPATPRAAFVSTSQFPIGSGAIPADRRLPGGSTAVKAARQEPIVLEKPEADVNGEDKPQLLAVEASNDSTAAVDDELCAVKEEEETSETQKLMKQVKDSGVAGVISYALWELGFWMISVPVVIFGYNAAVGHFPDLSDNDDLAKLGAEAFAFVNFARFAVPLRIGLALSTTPWIQSNVVDKYMKKSEEQCDEPSPASELSIVNGSDPEGAERVAAEATPEQKVPRWRSFLPFGRRKSE